MRSFLQLAALAASVVSVLASPGTVAAQQGTRVALIDIRQVFDSHSRFKARQDELKREYEDFNGRLRDQQKQYTTTAENLKRFKPGTVDYKRTETDLANMRARFTADKQLKDKEFMEREAKVYFEAYQEVQKQVTNFANEYGVSLVLNYNSRPMNKDNPQSVRMGVVRPVVYAYQQLDITKEIIKRVNAGVPPRKLGRAPQVPQRRSQVPPRRNPTRKR